MENIEIKNPDISEKRCAASVIIAREFANTPPTTSVNIKHKQMTETVFN